jgi:hypothetical protein
MGLWHVSSPAQDGAVVCEAHRNPFISERDLKAVTDFPRGGGAYFESKGSRSLGTTSRDEGASH